MAGGALTVIPPSEVATQFPVLVPDSPAAALIRANLAGDDVSVGDLDFIKVPPAGATSWTVPGPEGETISKTIEGVILHVARRRAYWRDSNPSNSPPDCRSNDCVTGIGSPGGACASCPMNEFGSAVRQGGGQGRGKACKETCLLFLLMPGANLPAVVKIPPSSLRALRSYRLKLTVPYFGAVTRLTLVKKPSKDGIAYSEVIPSLVGSLPVETQAQIQAYSSDLQSLFSSAADRDATGGQEGVESEAIEDPVF